MSARYAIEALTNRLKLVVGRMRVTGGVQNNDGGPVQTIQGTLSAKETPTLKRLSEFGFASRPLPGSDAIAVFVTGDRSNGVIIATGDQRYRFALGNDGEVALYDAFGKSVWFKKDSMVINANAKPVTIDNAKGLTVNATDDVIFNMNGNDFVINDPGTIKLGGDTKVVLDGDSVSGGEVVASSEHVTGS